MKGEIGFQSGDSKIRFMDHGHLQIEINGQHPNYELGTFEAVSLEWEQLIELNEWLGEQIELQQTKENTMDEKFTVAKLLIALKNRNESQMLSLNSSEQADLIPEVEKLLSELEKLQQENKEMDKANANELFPLDNIIIILKNKINAKDNFYLTFKYAEALLFHIQELQYKNLEFMINTNYNLERIQSLDAENKKLSKDNEMLHQNVHNKVNSVISGEQNKALEQIHLRLIHKYNSNQCLSLDRKEVGELADQIKRLFKENELLLLQNDVLKNENNTLNQECAKRIVENENWEKKYLKELDSTKAIESQSESRRVQNKRLIEDNERAKERIEDIKHTLELIPKCIYTNQHGNTHVDLKVLESFIRKALAKDNRIDGKLYAAKFHNAFEPTAIKWDGVGKFWYWYGNDTQYTDSFFEWISDTPINLEAAK